MDEVYRGYRIALKQTDRWIASITHVRGTHVPLDAQATLTDGPEHCLTGARDLIDRYLAFLSQNGIDGDAR